MNYKKEKYQNWCSDFCLTDAFQVYPQTLKEYAPEMLSFFIEEIFRDESKDDSTLELSMVTPAFQSIPTKFSLPASIIDHCPTLCSDFLEYLETSGRVGLGLEMASYVKLMKLKTKPETLKRPGSKLNRNDPCPCGSKIKYKKCCMNLL